MRLWSLHPQYLDPQGLVALWREALLAQAVLLGKTLSYRNHPQLARFKSSTEPEKVIGTYLTFVCDEAANRGYSFDATKIAHAGRRRRLKVTSMQLAFERKHLESKLRVRSPDLLNNLPAALNILPHPMFTVYQGPVEDWERV
jgi:Pyrimidine dimer DNA glycosylase